MDDDTTIDALRAELDATKKRLRDQEAALQFSEARYRLLFDHSPDLVLTVDFDGVIHSTNHTARRRLRQLAPELEGRELAEIFHANTADEVRQLFNDSVSGSLDRRFVLADDRVVLLRAAPVPGPDYLLQVVLRDVTSRVRMEEELERSRRLAAVGHLAAGVAHEINNPLTVMQLRIDLLREQSDDADLRGQLRVVRDHIQRVARIVQNLQTFARPKPTETVALRVVELINAARDLAAVPLEGILVVLDVPENLHVLGDPGSLEQVFVNLLVNAADAMSGTGRVTVDALSAGDRVQINVRDQGPGIPAELFDELFVPFTSSKQHRGTGLGLAIAWSLVNEHDGSITASNLPRGGACFTVVLPAVTHPTPAPARTPELPPRRAPKGDLLLLDDDPGVAAVIADASRRLGYRVVVVHTAQEALDLIAKRAFVALVADVQLPGMSGRELLDRLRDRHPELAARTLLMSGLFLEPESGVRYLQKPFSRAALDAALREL